MKKVQINYSGDTKTVSYNVWKKGIENPEKFFGKLFPGSVRGTGNEIERDGDDTGGEITIFPYVGAGSSTYRYSITENTIKKSDIRKIVKEEIIKALKEAIEPSEYLKQKFPEVIEYDRTTKLSDLNWTVLTNKQWTNEDAYEFQSAAGYSPMGYGGPYKFDEESIDGGNFEYTWHCAASS